MAALDGAVIMQQLDMRAMNRLRRYFKTENGGLGLSVHKFVGCILACLRERKVSLNDFSVPTPDELLFLTERYPPFFLVNTYFLNLYK